MYNSHTYTEATLVAELQLHNKAAFGYLYEHYKGALNTVIRQVIQDEEIANDVLQDAFVTIWKNINKYDASKGRLFTWLYNIARNSAINTTRSKVFKSEQKNDSIDNYVNYTNGLKADEWDINQIGLRKEVHKLKDDYKKVIELSYFNGYTQREIATMLAIPEGTVKTRMRNALIELRKQFV